MFDTLDFAQDILTQEINPALSAEALGLLSSNRQHLTAIVAYQHLTDNWDEDGAIAPVHQTVLAALNLALLLTVTEQLIYHTSPGPVGEIMINLRNGDKSAELLVYPNGRNKLVRIGHSETPQQGLLTPESLRETLQWLN
ncbi:hypothetical protein EXU85_04940 [Spirosoma sp. KCTC 42546]|uniref:hypothetical protein n=1 Tax=Spirosoma sp. KCTC 42546 TaxID=2520506 RepID=UPI00115C1067|nr:hypothetical protein [Spirosoma sp. KCTC 42546]QDK77970.1 hypothetical protein EXU85_04940 [Spirosoma sp. KCTC 42546]